MKKTQLNFTGKTTIEIELEESSPIIFHINDKQLTTMLFKFILDNCEDEIQVENVE
jgi:hypothetical protein